MAVETTTAFSGPYTTNGVTVVFPFTFIAMSIVEVAVLLRSSGGVDSIVSPASYTVTLTDDGTGSVTFDVAPASGSQLYVYSDVSFEQSIEFEDGSGWRATPVNKVSDRSAARDIWLKDRTSRSLTAPVGEALNALPPASERATNFLSFDADGNPAVAVGGISSVPVSSFGASLVSSDTAADARSALGVSDVTTFSSAATLLDSKIDDTSIVILTDSTGDAVDEWPYLLADGNYAAARPEYTVKICYFSGVSYGALTTLQNGTGTKTVTFYVAAVAGTAADYFAGELFDIAVITPDPDLIFVSYGHNGDVQGVGPFTITPTRQLSFFNSLADKIEKNMPTTPVFMIGQNPSTQDNGTNPAGTNDGFMETRLKVLRPFAAQRGWRFINVHGAFLESDTPLADLLVDDVHTNTAGAQLWADTVYTAMLQEGIDRNSEGVILRAWASRLDFNEWGTSNVTVTKNTTAGRYETLAQSTVLTVTSTAAAGYIFLQVLNGDDIPVVAGKYVTFSVWMQNKATNLGNSGRLELDDGVGSTISTGMVKGDGFTLFTVTHLVADAATTLTAYIYAADATQVSANVIDIDRASISVGTRASDPATVGSVRARRLTVSGSNSGGIGVFYNIATSAAGLRFVASDSADPLTAWTSDFRQDGFAVKQAADTDQRYEVTTSGGFRMGGGAAATDMGIDRQLAGVMRFSGADLYPDTNNTRYIGANGSQWRGIFLRGTGGGDGVFMNNVRVVGDQGAAVADATDAATAITQLNALLARMRSHGLIAT